MFIDTILAWIIVVILAGAVAFFIYFLIDKKTTIGSKPSNTIGWIIFIGLLVLFHWNTKTVYIINNKTDHSSYLLFGTKNYRLKNGNIIEINKSFRYCIINDYDKRLLFSPVYYKSKNSIGGGSTNGSLIMIEPYSFTITEVGIDYFMNESPPSTKSSNAISDTDYWLHE